jgi:hypothetical protein
MQQYKLKICIRFANTASTNKAHNKIIIESKIKEEEGKSREYRLGPWRKFETDVFLLINNQLVISMRMTSSPTNDECHLESAVARFLQPVDDVNNWYTYSSHHQVGIGWYLLLGPAAAIIAASSCRAARAVAVTYTASVQTSWPNLNIH